MNFDCSSKRSRIVSSGETVVKYQSAPKVVFSKLLGFSKLFQVDSLVHKFFWVSCVIGWQVLISVLRIKIVGKIPVRKKYSPGWPHDTTSKPVVKSMIFQLFQKNHDFRPIFHGYELVICGGIFGGVRWDTFISHHLEGFVHDTSTSLRPYDFVHFSKSILTTVFPTAQPLEITLFFSSPEGAEFLEVSNRCQFNSHRWRRKVNRSFQLRKM